MKGKNVLVHPFIPVIIDKNVDKNGRTSIYIKPKEDLLIKEDDEIAKVFIEGNFEKECNLKEGTLKIIGDGIRTMVIKNESERNLLDYRFPPNENDIFGVSISEKDELLKIENFGLEPLNVFITNR